MTNDSIRLFENEEFGSVRAFRDETGEPWFIARDICNALDLSNLNMALKSLEDDEKGVTIVDTLGGNQRIMAEVA